MNINYDTFLDWAEKHFDNVDTVGNEIKVNSCFTDDNKNHMWCNPSKNAYHCWKTDKSGNLIDLVSRVGGCSFQEAAALLSDDNDLRALETRLEKLFEKKYNKIVVPPHLAFPADTFPIRNMPKVEKYLTSRKIPIDGLLFCVSGKCRNRVVIPYYGKNGDLVYWNARDITGFARTKYIGPDSKEHGVGKGDVIYMQGWKASKVYLAEGEFDAMSLTQCGLHGAACGGKILSDKQVELLKPYQVCICFDADKSGAMALNKIGDKLISSGVQSVSYVRPPTTIKDWNKMLVDLGQKMVNTYIIAQEKSFTPWTSNALRLNNR